MDVASLEVLRLTVEVSLRAASLELQRQQDDLVEAEKAVERCRDALRALRAERHRTNASLAGMVGCTLSVAELREHDQRGAVLEAREAAGTRARGAAADAVTRIARRVEEARREVGTLLARQRWVDDALERGVLEARRQAARREDEE